VRAVLVLAMIPLVGCSSLLGIVDPSTGTRIDGGVDAVDAPAGDHLLFSANLAPGPDYAAGDVRIGLYLSASHSSADAHPLEHPIWAVGPAEAPHRFLPAL
jgi:hypothetical protein